MRTHFLMGLSAAALVLGPVIAGAQPPNRGVLRPATDSRGGLQAFERTAPQVGDRLPEIEGVEANGEKIKLSSLRGDYVVLVFGCLT